MTMTHLKSIGRYRIENETLGKGYFAVVELATDTVCNTKVAIKVIDLRKVKEDYVRENLYREAKVLSQLRHPNIIRIYETIESTSLYCLVTEYASGGDLLSVVRRHRGGRLTEGSARPYVRQLVSALHHMHERRVVHRDLKMENIMLDAKHKNIKIVDFGLSTTYDSGQKLETHCGSADYAAPELFVPGQNYGPEVDIWSMGICMYAMITGHLPFTTPHSENKRLHLLQQIQFGLGPRHGANLQHVSTDCQELLTSCIEPNPGRRIPLLDIELHPWLTNRGKEIFTSYRQLPKDKNTSLKILEKMSGYLKLPVNQIKQRVNDYQLDEFSAIYNIMLDDVMQKKRSVYNDDHTLKKKPTVQHISILKPEQSAPTVNDDTSQDIPESPRPKTPAVVGLVNFSNHMLNKQPIDKLSFELAVLSDSDTKRNNRPMTAICPPPTGNKTKLIGNATTVNNVIARNYNNTKSNEKRYRRPKTTATCRASQTHTYREELLRGQKWQCSKSRTKADTGKTAKETYPKPQATLAMLAAIDIADENNFKAILRPTKSRLTPSPDIYNIKSLQTNHGNIRSKEINVVNMNKTFKHGYQLSSTMYNTQYAAGSADAIKLDEFKPKLEIKLKESNVRYNGRVKEVSFENTDRDVSSPVPSTDQVSRPVTRHQTKTPTVVSMTPMPGENEATPNGLQSSMPQRICWQRRAGAAAGKEKEKNKDNKIKILISKNNIHQTFPEGDISVVSKRVDTGNSSRRTSRPKTGNSSRRAPRPKTGTGSRQTYRSPHSRNTENSMYTAAEDAPTECSALICNECQKTKDVRLDCKMLFMREPSSYGETANNCSHQKKYNLHKQYEEMKQSDYLSYKRAVSSPQNILSKKAVSMLRRRQHKAADNKVQSQPRPSMKYGEANIVTIVTKPPILKIDKNKNIAERNHIGNTINQSRAEDKELYKQMTSFGYTLERRLSNAFKDGHIISMMKRTSDDFALNVY